VAYLVRTSRVGRSQGASIFWGIVSSFFAAAACYYYWENHKNETGANTYRDQVMVLREQIDDLNSQKDKLQSSVAETESQLKTREDLIQQKETELAAEESGLEELGQSQQKQSQQNQAQVAMVKKFNDLILKLGKDGPTDVVERGGRPVLRIPNAQLFAPGDTVLKPEGKALLTQIAQAVNGQIDTFELRVVTYTDSNAEAPDSADAAAKAKLPTSWDLTATRAANIARFYRDQSPLPFLNVLVIGRGDSEPISSKDGGARNRRVEITITPLPISFHSPEPDKTRPAPIPAPVISSPPTPASTTNAAGTSPAKPKSKPADKKSPH
jgi:flagellar motor protein MotB